MRATSPIIIVALLCACTARPGTIATLPAPAVDLAQLNLLVDRQPVPASDEISAEDVRTQMAEIFGDADLAATSLDLVDADISSDLAIVDHASNERVMFFFDTFTGKSRAQTISFLSRGTQYETMIRSKLREAGLPEDLYYLAMIESGFSADAYSSAAAVGMWQFMTATAKGEGLKVDWWLDERRDPALATVAAVKHLSWLRRQFGSDFLAAAAYNGGSGIVSRGLTRHASAVGEAEGDGVFFALAETNYFRAETRDYVPKLIAAALVAKSASRLAMHFDSVPPEPVDSVRVGPATPIPAVARAVGIDAASVAMLNNHVLRGVTHPRDSMWIRVPQGLGADFAAKLAALPASARVPYTRSKSRAGETFAAVAKRLGIPARQLAWYNPRDGVSRRVLPAGSTILVPSPAVRGVAKDVPNPSIEIYGGAGSRYVVKRGDTLGAIALRFRTSVAAIKRLNRMSGDVIRVGQSLRVR